MAVEAKRNVYLLGSLYRYVFKEWEAKPKQASPLWPTGHKGLSLCQFFPLLLHLLVGEKEKSKELL